LNAGNKLNLYYKKIVFSSVSAFVVGVLYSSILASSIILIGKNRAEKRKTDFLHPQTSIVKSTENFACYENLKNEGSITSSNKTPKTLESRSLSKDLSLIGIFHSGLENAKAVIENRKTGKQKVYKVGDFLEDGTLHKILRNSVIVQFINRQERLAIESGISLGDDQARQINLSRFHLERYISNIGDLIAEIDIEPFESEYGSNAIQVSGIEPGSLPDILGFKNGDIIKSINGVKIRRPYLLSKMYTCIKFLPLGQFSSGLFPINIFNDFPILNGESYGVIHEIRKAYSQIESGKEVPISVLRGNNEKTINFTIR